MGFITWIVLGLVSGWIASIFMKTDNSQGAIQDIVLGVFGAIVGGWIMNFFGEAGVTGFNLYSVVVAVIGAMILIWIGRFFNNRR